MTEKFLNENLTLAEVRDLIVEWIKNEGFCISKDDDVATLELTMPDGSVAPDTMTLGELRTHYVKKRMH